MVNRRQFLGMGAAVAGAAALPACSPTSQAPTYPLQDENGRLLWQNWSGLEHSYPANRAAPADLEQLRTLLGAAPAPIRAVGAGHSFTGLCTSEGTLLSLDNLSGLVRHDPVTHSATLKAGTRLQQMGQLLADIGQDMLNIPDINKQSLGGALGTATHGTGAKIPALHGDVMGLRLVTPSGQVIDADAEKDPEVFQAARVSLGALGVISQVRIRTSANRRLRRRVWLEPFDEALANAEARWAQHRNFEFYAVPFTGLAANISHDETDDPALLEARAGRARGG